MKTGRRTDAQIATQVNPAGVRSALIAEQSRDWGFFWLWLTECLTDWSFVQVDCWIREDLSCAESASDETRANLWNETERV